MGDICYLISGIALVTMALALLLPPRHRSPHHEHDPRPVVPSHPVASRLPLLCQHVHIHLLAPHAEAVPCDVPSPTIPHQRRRGSSRPRGSSTPSCPTQGCPATLRGGPDRGVAARLRRGHPQAAPRSSFILIR